MNRYRTAWYATRRVASAISSEGSPLSTASSTTVDSDADRTV